jgi:hypothetical protein
MTRVSEQDFGGNLKERDYCENFEVDGRIILNGY